MNNYLKKLVNLTENEKGGKAVSSTNSDVVDFFSKVGNYRNRDLSESWSYKPYQQFIKAMAEDRELAMKSLFYARDCRIGMGEKNVFRNITTRVMHDGYLNDLVLNNLNLILEVGSWKDILHIFYESPKERKPKIAEFICNQIKEDMANLFQSDLNISLLGKWLPTINSKSENTRKKAVLLNSYLQKFMKFSYREFCKKARRKINIIETHIASKEYGKIDYSKVPSKAMNTWKHLFYEYDGKRFEEYLSSVTKGETKINTTTLTPVDVVEMYEKDWNPPYDESSEVLWKNLKNPFKEPLNALVVADTSGSMVGRPMTVSKALSIYIAENNPSEVYRNLIIEFSNNPRYYDISKKKSLHSKLLGFAGEVAETRIDKVFDLILNTAIKSNLKQEGLPKYIIVISDMQFDDGVNLGSKKNTVSTVMEQIRDKWKQHGYTLPKLVYWNVATADNFPEESKDGIIYLSGGSQNILKALYDLENFNPLEFIKEIVLIDKYKNMYVG